VPIRTIIFDLFDTLVDLGLPRMAAAPAGARPVHSTAARLHEAMLGQGGGGAEISLERFVEVLREVDRSLMLPRHREGRELSTVERFETLADLLGLADPALPGLLTEVHMGALTEYVSTPEHHPETLAGLGRRRQLGLCSNFTHAETARRVLQEARLDPHLDAVVISEEVGIRKPRAEIFQATLDALDARPDETLHVGDNLSADVGGAAALGVGTVWITRRVREPEAALKKYQGPPPDWTIGDLAELEPLLEAR